MTLDDDVAGSAENPYRLVPHESSVWPGFDLVGVNRLADELEDEVIIAAARHTS